MKKFVFRFDIDTHKCIRDGVPNLLQVSEKYNVPFTFYLNTGRAVSLKDSIKSMVCHSEAENGIEMMSARKKLGNWDYLVAAIINPLISRYYKQIDSLLHSSCEVGIHGGDNHAQWQLYAENWDQTRVKQEIQKAIRRVADIYPDFHPAGFASPAWNSPQFLPEILNELGFTYYADFHSYDDEPIRVNQIMKNVGVNLLGEPGGVAFWENCRVKGMNNADIIKKVDQVIDDNDTIVVYDHPYYAGVKEIESINEVIEHVQSRGCLITTVQKIAE